MYAIYAMYAMYATLHLLHAINATLHTLHATNAIFDKRKNIQQIWTLTIFIQGMMRGLHTANHPGLSAPAALVHHLWHNHHKAMEIHGGISSSRPHFQGIWLVSLHVMYAMYPMSHLLHATNAMSHTLHATNAMLHTLHATNAMYAMCAINARKSDVV
jgi:hypothetical protein